MKPAIAAGTKPNSIAWMCQESGSKRLGNVPPVMKRTIHKASASAAQTAAARKKGRNARDHRLAGGLSAATGATIATTHLVRTLAFLRPGTAEVEPALRDNLAVSSITIQRGRT